MQDEGASRTFLASALAERIRGFEVVERRVELALGGRELRAELAGADALGRAWIVVAADGDGERALMDALEWRAFAAERGRELVDAWEIEGGARERDEAPPIHVAIVSLSADAALERRARAAGIALYVLERWSGASGASLHLVSRGDDAHALGARPDVFLRALDEPARALAERALARVTRLDEALELVAGRERITWLARGRELASLSARDGALAGRTAGRRAEQLLARDADVERWLENALAEHLDAEDGEPLGNATARALDPETPILSAEELDAFRD